MFGAVTLRQSMFETTTQHLEEDFFSSVSNNGCSFHHGCNVVVLFVVQIFLLGCFIGPMHEFAFKVKKQPLTRYPYHPCMVYGIYKSR